MDQNPMRVVAGVLSAERTGEREKAGAAAALVEDRPAGGRLDAAAGAEKIELGGRGAARPGAHPQRPHPHWTQERQEEARTTGPAHSGHRRMSNRVAGLG